MQPSITLYADHAATAPLWPSVREAMAPYLAERFGNASSSHAAGRLARTAVEESREVIAAALGARAQEVIFTSGGTESDNLALTGVFERARADRRDGIVLSAIEHHAVLECAEWLAERRGARLSIAPVSSDGVVEPSALAGLVDERTAIVSIMAANNEVGTIQPVAEVAEIARAEGARVHTDAVQALPWIDVRAEDADLIAITAHKCGGPKGAGALVVRSGIRLEPMLHGGGQERGIRSGTYNVAGIVGFAAAVREVVAARQRAATIETMRDRLQASITSRLVGVYATGARAHRLPNSCHVCIEGVGSEPLLLLLDEAGVAASSGSACQSGATEPSHVLSAMGVPKELAEGALRLTIGWTTTEDDVDRIAGAVVRAVETLR
ncbi:MAG: cysteine desulfurase family protein [Actinomycetota bacterium]